MGSRLTIMQSLPKLLINLGVIISLSSVVILGLGVESGTALAVFLILFVSNIKD